MAAAGPSPNWLSLQKTFQKKSRPAHRHKHGPPLKRRKLTPSASSPIRTPHQPTEHAHETLDFPRGSKAPFTFTHHGDGMEKSVGTVSASREGEEDVKNGESLSGLRAMILGPVELPGVSTTPGKYLALDCEMVGVGPEGAESSLARVSIVNFHGAVLLDELVQQRERVTDYRTEWSGIRPGDMVRANPFPEVQKRVADLLKERVLIGHAIHNDLKALLLSHPRDLKRDTQVLAAKHKLTKSNRPALRHLVEQEVGVTIQGGEHSSVTDARATMAVYRLHRKLWDQGLARTAHTHAHARTAEPADERDAEVASSSKGKGKKRRRADDEGDELGDDDNDDHLEMYIADDASGGRADSASEAEGEEGGRGSRQAKIKSSAGTKSKSKSKSKSELTTARTGGGGGGGGHAGGGQGKKGVSSGLSTVVRYRGRDRDGADGTKNGGTGDSRSATRSKLGAGGGGRVGEARAGGVESKAGWWEALPGGAVGSGAKGSKGSMRLHM